MAEGIVGTLIFIGFLSVQFLIFGLFRFWQVFLKKGKK